MQECITSTFAEDSGDPRLTMRRFADLKNQAHRALEDLLQNPGSAAMGDRRHGCHPAASWAVNWPLDRKFRGDASNLECFYRHCDSSQSSRTDYQPSGLAQMWN